jgi:hypothetical protein
LPGPTARVLAILYDDAFQLLVLNDSPLRSFTDLKGERIALAESGGQFQSFLRVAEHFGLHQGDFHFVGSSDEAADEAFSYRHADAIFRVHALDNPSIQRLVQSGKVRFLPIEHAAAITLKYSAFTPARIPEGAYPGNPPVLPQDLPTIAVHRTLLARVSADACTGIFPRRNPELALRYIRALSVQNQQKNAADQYSNRVVALMSSAQEANSQTSLEANWCDLLSILAESVHDLDADNLSEKSFDSFRSVLEIALDVTRDRHDILARASPADSVVS